MSLTLLHGDCREVLRGLYLELARYRGGDGYGDEEVPEAIREVLARAARREMDPGAREPLMTAEQRVLETAVTWMALREAWERGDRAVWLAVLQAYEEHLDTCRAYAALVAQRHAAAKVAARC